MNRLIKDPIKRPRPDDFNDMEIIFIQPPRKRRKLSNEGSKGSEPRHVEGTPNLQDQLPVPHLLKNVFNFLPKKDIRKIALTTSRFFHQSMLRSRSELHGPYLNNFVLSVDGCFLCYLECTKDMITKMRNKRDGERKYKSEMLVLPQSFPPMRKHRISCNKCGKIECPNVMLTCQHSEAHDKDEQAMCRKCVRHCYFCKKIICKSCCRKSGTNELLRRCTNPHCKKLICRTCHKCPRSGCDNFISATLCKFCYQFDKCIRCTPRKSVAPKRGWVPRMKKIHRKSRAKKKQSQRISDLQKKVLELEKEIEERKHGRGL